MITQGKVVNLKYQLKNSKGKTLDESSAKDPFVYLHGGGQIVTGLEAALEGMKIGDKKSVVVAPEDGYGEIDPTLRLALKRTQFPADLELEAGMQFEAGAHEGEGLVFTIESISGEEVWVNGNHPLAGETLHFDVEVLAVRDATEEELSHGHAHGAGGHHH